MRVIFLQFIDALTRLRYTAHRELERAGERFTGAVLSSWLSVLGVVPDEAVGSSLSGVQVA